MPNAKEDASIAQALRELRRKARRESRRNDWTFPILGAVAVVFTVGFAAGGEYVRRGIDECVERAEQGTGYGSNVARAYYFAQCVRPKVYLPAAQ